MTDMRTNSLVEYDHSAALGKSTPVDNVPVGFMVLATCPLILWLLDGTVAGFASALLVIGLFTVGMVFLSIGQKNHLAYDKAEVAARPRIPFKLIGSFIVALVVGLLATAKVGQPTIPFLIGTAIFILCLLSFGLDPMRDKGLNDPVVRLRLANQKLYQTCEDRFEALLTHLQVLQDDDLTERTRAIADTVMGLLGTIDFETQTLQKMAPPLEKLLCKMEAETNALVGTGQQAPSPFARRKFQTKMQALASAFEVRARKNGIAHGRNGFELQANLLFDRMQRNRQT
ncbi:hypothetical protein ACG74X_12150 [Marivita sp. S0852]|uniref:hypothetical protein n=1 Tax=Marivita sp. S0852 TaxID=3373893 RepID=UPI00398235B2